MVRERRGIRWLVALLALIAAALGLGLPIPAKLPSVALGSSELLLVERSLAFLYAFLLFSVPIIRALQGQLPIELSARGARWQETTAASERTLNALNARIDELWDTIEPVLVVLPALVEAPGPVDESPSGKVK